VQVDFTEARLRALGRKISADAIRYAEASGRALAIPESTFATAITKVNADKAYARLVLDYAERLAAVDGAISPKEQVTLDRLRRLIGRI
jgi:tellurite resistance protein